MVVLESREVAEVGMKLPEKLKMVVAAGSSSGHGSKWFVGGFVELGK